MEPTSDPGSPRGLDAAALSRLLGDQSGVVSRAQVMASGGAPHDLGRLVRRRQLVRVLPGVFVDHTGEPTLSPPRIRVAEAALDEALRQPTRFAMIGVLADVCQSRRTTAQRMLEAAGQRDRLADRAWLCGILADIADGTCSMLEHAYLDRVERAHGPPVGQRQRPGTSELSGVLRDVDDDPLPCLGWGQVIDRPCRTAARVAALLARAGGTGTPTRCGPDCQL